MGSRSPKNINRQVIFLVPRRFKRSGMELSVKGNLDD